MNELPNRFGITLPGAGVRDHLELARYADRVGVDSIWVIETRLTTDAISPLAVYASATERIRLGAGVLPLWTRNPALIAQTFATLDMLVPGRMILGLGGWWEPLASRTGAVRKKPLRAMREVVESVRSLLAMNEPVTYQGEYVHMDRLYLDHGGTSPHDVKIYIGAVGPQMLRLAGRIADGVVLNSNHTVDAVRRAVEEIKKGAELAGRSLDDVDRVKPTHRQPAGMVDAQDCGSPAGPVRQYSDSLLGHHCSRRSSDQRPGMAEINHLTKIPSFFWNKQSEARIFVAERRRLPCCTASRNQGRILKLKVLGRPALWC